MPTPTNTIGYATPGFVPGVPLNHPGTQQAVFARRFKERLREKSILRLITNSQYQGEFKHAGQEVGIPVLPLIKTYKMKPGDKMQYQTPKSTLETFYIGRERGFGLHLEDEDKVFARFDIEAPIMQEAMKQLDDDKEYEFFSDILSKPTSVNSGNTAGFLTRDVHLGSIATPVMVTKTAAEAATSTTGVTYKAAAPDYFVEAIGAMQQHPAGSDADFKIVCHTTVGTRLQTSELRNADWTGDAQSIIRGNVKGIGKLNGSDVIVNNRLPIYKTTVNGTAVNCYPVLFIDKSAISYIEEVAFRDTGMKDIDYWGTFNRNKIIYDWFILYPERFGVGFVIL